MSTLQRLWEDYPDNVVEQREDQMCAMTMLALQITFVHKRS